MEKLRHMKLKVMQPKKKNPHFQHLINKYSLSFKNKGGGGWGQREGIEEGSD